MAKVANAKVAEILQQGMTRARVRRPDLRGTIGQVIAANDYASQIKAVNEVKAGRLGRKDSLVRVGSFALMDHVFSLINMAGQMGWPADWYETDIEPDLLGIWSRADPDDTQVRYLELFEKAKARRSPHAPLHDGHPLDMHVNGGKHFVYRGEPGKFNPEGMGGLSWSLDMAVATKFATGAVARSPGAGVVYAGVAEYPDVLAFITGRGEQELIIAPENVQIMNYGLVSATQPGRAVDWMAHPANAGGEIVVPKSLRERTRNR